MPRLLAGGKRPRGWARARAGSDFVRLVIEDLLNNPFVRLHHLSFTV